MRLRLCPGHLYRNFRPSAMLAKEGINRLQQDRLPSRHHVRQLCLHSRLTVKFKITSVETIFSRFLVLHPTRAVHSPPIRAVLLVPQDHENERAKSVLFALVKSVRRAGAPRQLPSQARLPKPTARARSSCGSTCGLSYEPAVEEIPAPACAEGDHPDFEFAHDEGDTF